ncbi:MAG: hypothetical protein ABFC63_02340 [Thermoguttaceae bacterium]
MDTIESKGNTQYGQPTELGEGKRTEHRAWSLPRELPERERQVSLEVVGSGSMIEAAGGFVAIVLSIISMAGVAPAHMIAVAGIVVGLAMLVDSGSVAGRFWQLPVEMSTGRWAATQLATGITAGFLGGLAGVVLGIVALTNITVWALLSVSILVFGAVLLIASDMTLRMNYLEATGAEGQASPSPTGHHATLIAAGVQVVLGAVAVLFGVLALVGIAPVALTKIAMLIIGISMFVSGTAIARRMMCVLRRGQPSCQAE